MDKETVIKINDLTSSIESQEKVIKGLKDYISMLTVKKRGTDDDYLTLGDHLEVSNEIMMEAANRKLEIEIQELDSLKQKS